MGPDAAAVVMGTPRAVMAAALEELDATYGGIVRYLADSASLTPTDLTRLPRASADVIQLDRPQGRTGRRDATSGRRFLHGVAADMATCWGRRANRSVDTQWHPA